MLRLSKAIETRSLQHITGESSVVNVTSERYPIDNTSLLCHCFQSVTIGTASGDDKIEPRKTGIGERTNDMLDALVFNEATDCRQIRLFP
jgi:hypothetical protein